MGFRCEELRCLKCQTWDVVVIGTGDEAIDLTCRECGGQRIINHMRAPSVDARAPWRCVQTDNTYSSYSQLDRWAKENGKVVMSPKEWESRKKPSPEERLDTKAHARMRKEAILKAKYRLEHGYKD